MDLAFAVGNNIDIYLPLALFVRRHEGPIILIAWIEMFVSIDQNVKYLYVCTSTTPYN